MKPPPVTQQPPSVGGTQSTVVLSSTHAPQAAACVPAPQAGALVQVLLPFESLVHVNVLPPIPLCPGEPEEPEELDAPEEPEEPEEPVVEVSPAFLSWPGEPAEFPFVGLVPPMSDDEGEPELELLDVEPDDELVEPEEPAEPDEPEVSAVPEPEDAQYGRSLTKSHSEGGFAPPKSLEVLCGPLPLPPALLLPPLLPGPVGVELPLPVVEPPDGLAPP
jgi:hypothetical protein